MRGVGRPDEFVDAETARALRPVKNAQLTRRKRRDDRHVVDLDGVLQVGAEAAHERDLCAHLNEQQLRFAVGRSCARAGLRDALTRLLRLRVLRCLLRLLLRAQVFPVQLDRDQALARVPDAHDHRQFANERQQLRADERVDERRHSGRVVTQHEDAQSQ